MTGEYMRLELRMIFRNKTPRKNFQMMCIVLVLFAAMLFGITQESTQSVYSIQLYSIYCFTGFAVSILTRIMAYEGNYLDGLMVRRESLLSLFRAKYYFHCLLLGFPLVLLLPSIIWSGLPAAGSQPAVSYSGHHPAPHHATGMDQPENSSAGRKHNG